MALPRRVQVNTICVSCGVVLIHVKITGTVVLYEFSFVAVTNYCKLRGLTQHLGSYHSGGRKSKTKLLAGLCSFWRL